jgi:hypothetical protein
MLTKIKEVLSFGLKHISQEKLEELEIPEENLRNIQTFIGPRYERAKRTRELKVT